MERVAVEAEKAAHHYNLKELYTETKLLSRCLKKLCTAIRMEDSKVITIEEEVLERWKEHFSEILSVACEETYLPDGCQLGDCKDPIEVGTGPFTIQELRQVISPLKNG